MALKVCTFFGRFLFSLQLFSTVPALSNTSGAQLEVNNVWARSRIKNPLWTFCLSACLSAFDISCFHPPFFYFFLGHFFFNLSVSVSCSEVCRLWPRRSGEIWVQQPVWLPDRGRRCSVCRQDHSALHTVCATGANQGQRHHQQTAMGDASYADALHPLWTAGKCILTPSTTFPSSPLSVAAIQQWASYRFQDILKKSLFQNHQYSVILHLHYDLTHSLLGHVPCFFIYYIKLT